MAAYIAGELAVWPTKHRLAKILRSAGLDVDVGQFSVRIQDCSSFIFQEYGGDLGEPIVDADTVADMIRDGQIVSDALSRAGVKHRFEIYDDCNTLAGYLHHEWPLQDNGPSAKRT